MGGLTRKALWLFREFGRPVVASVTESTGLISHNIHGICSTSNRTRTVSQITKHTQCPAQIIIFLELSPF